MAVGVIARLTFREAARRRILLAAVALGLLFLAVYGVGLRFIIAELNEQSGIGLLERREISNFLMLAGLYVVNFLTILMAVLTSVDTIAGEIASGTIHTLAAKPIRRWEIVLGKWLGFAFMLSLYLLLMAGGVMLAVVVLADYRPPEPLRGVAYLWLNAILVLGVSLAGGAALSTLANGVLVFGLFGVAFVGGWIEQIGSVVQNQTAIQIGVLSSLLLPTEAIWKRAAFELQSPLISAAVGFSPFTARSVPSAIMTFYAAGYAALAVFLAVSLFQRRDL